MGLVSECVFEWRLDERPCFICLFLRSTLFLQCLFHLSPSLYKFILALSHCFNLGVQLQDPRCFITKQDYPVHQPARNEGLQAKHQEIPWQSESAKPNSVDGRAKLKKGYPLNWVKFAEWRQSTTTSSHLGRAYFWRAAWQRIYLRPEDGDEAEQDQCQQHQVLELERQRQQPLQWVFSGGPAVEHAP